jgi:putative ABC transport system permease protein
MMRAPSLDQLRESLTQAIDSLRAGKLRSALTVLGVVIGVATVMTMATLVRGVQDQIVRSLEVAGPTTFYVMRVYSMMRMNPGRMPKELRDRPDLEENEALRIAQLPSVRYAGIWATFNARLEYAGTRTQALGAFGADDRFAEIQGGDLVDGRWFTHTELRSGAPVAVIHRDQAEYLFGRATALGKVIRVGGRPVTVIGLYLDPGNIFAPHGQSVGAVLPYRFVKDAYTLDKSRQQWIPVKPAPGVSVADAQADVTVALREMRHLRPADPNSFDLVTQDQILSTFNSLTSMFFLVMIVLASVALLVGGIGVMAIMTVSVTARTREIGVRKAVGASRRDILLQFLIEASTLTGIGGAIGIVCGLVAGRVVSQLMNIQGSPPVTLTLIAVTVSVGIGLVFGVAPARRAARLDPVDALRYE